MKVGNRFKDAACLSQLMCKSDLLEHVFDVNGKTDLCQVEQEARIDVMKVLLTPLSGAMIRHLQLAFLGYTSGYNGDVRYPKDAIKF